MTKEKHNTPDPIEQCVRSMPFYKKIIFALLPLAILLLLLETGARLVYYQVHGDHKSALVAAVHELQDMVALAGSVKKVKTVENHLPKGTKTAWFTPQGAELLVYRDRQDFKPTPQEEEYFAGLRALESKPAQASRPQ